MRGLLLSVVHSQKAVLRAGKELGTKTKTVTRASLGELHPSSLRRSQDLSRIVKYLQFHQIGRRRNSLAPALRGEGRGEGSSSWRCPLSESHLEDRQRIGDQDQKCAAARQSWRTSSFILTPYGEAKICPELSNTCNSIKSVGDVTPSPRPCGERAGVRGLLLIAVHSKKAVFHQGTA